LSPNTQGSGGAARPRNETIHGDLAGSASDKATSDHLEICHIANVEPTLAGSVGLENASDLRIGSQVARGSSPRHGSRNRIDLARDLISICFPHSVQGAIVEP